MEGHPRCEACLQYAGPGHELISVSDFRGHQLCDLDKKWWLKREKEYGRIFTWEEADLEDWLTDDARTSEKQKEE